MKKIQKDKLEKALNSYFKEIHKIYVAGGFRERGSYDFALKVDDLLHMDNINKDFKVK